MYVDNALDASQSLTAHCSISQSIVGHYAVVSCAINGVPRAAIFLCILCKLFNVMENIHGCLMNTFRHVGKSAIIAQKLQCVACNKLHTKPRH